MSNKISINQVIAGAAAFITAFANLAFFRNVLDAFGNAPLGYVHALSLGMVLWCLLIVLLALLCFRATLKPVLTALFLLSALTAYFMDTYNVIIDRDMLINAASTDMAETRDLLTPRLLLYLVLLGAVPALVVLKLPLRQEPLGQAVLARARLTGVALLGAFALMMVSSGFYASFFREHKALRYYTNPTAPIQAAIQFGRMHVASVQTMLQEIGADANVPASDIEHELVIMVVGETARADHFSLNGYPRDTNPRLAREDVVSFSRVSACGTSTAISVPCMFAVYDRDQYSGDKARGTENALDVLTHAGVHILWRDNNSSSKGVADRIPTEDFRSPQTNSVCDVECRDEGMLVGLQEFIDRQPSGDILIVLHQMGSHGPAYFKRYPAEFGTFQPTCDSNQLDSCTQEQVVNAYDNSIRYTDHFLGKVIDLLRANDDRFETAMLYASDHGESLGESGLYLHGLPYFVAPEAQTHVPVVMWFGRHYDDIDTAALRRLSALPLSHDNLFHTLLGLFELDTAVYDTQKDLLQLARQNAAEGVARR